MNDSHVVALLYRIEHSDSFEYSREATPLYLENEAFGLSVEDKEARFELCGHYPTIEEAAEALEGYIRLWEFNAQLEKGPGSFRLVLDYGESEIIDRNPTPGHEEVFIHEVATTCDSVTSKLTLGEYPAPPSDMALNDDIETMHWRYMRYKNGREPLASVAYFCLSMVEDRPRTDSTRREPNKRRAAAGKLGVALEFLAEVGRLSSTRGGSDARKREGTESPLSPEEHHFLYEAVRTIIRRAAQKEYSQKPLPIISLSDLPSLEGENRSGAKTRKEA